MITYLKINGFKSFHNFEMEFTPLTIVAGTNAAGKSNLFDALNLLSRLAEVDKIHTAFREGQRGDLFELFTQYDEHAYADEMEFCVEVLVNREVTDAWGATARLKYTRLRYELKIHRFVNSSGIDDLEVVYEHLATLKHQEDKWIKLLPKEQIEFWRPKVITGKRGQPYIYTQEQNELPTVFVPQDGGGGNKRSFPLRNATRTVLSSMDSVDFRHILAVKQEMISWRFLQLNPEDLRQPTSKRTGEDVIGVSGKNLAAALFRIQQEDKYSLVEISRELNSFIPNYTQVFVEDDTENKQYIIYLKNVDGKKYSSRVLSEGTLRLLTLCILQHDMKYSGLLCFEEPENGIHPFRIKSMAKLLKDLTTNFEDHDLPLRQVIVNTHSTVFVGEIQKWEDDLNVSIHFAEMKSRVLSLPSGNKVKLDVSKIIQVPKEGQLTINFSEQERKLSLQMIKEYLENTLKEW